jgi:hypothetical protein
VSIELEAKVTTTATLAEVLAHAESVLSRVPHRQFVIDTTVPPDAISIAPFAVAGLGVRPYDELPLWWQHGYLRISLGRIAAVTLVVRYRTLDHELKPAPIVPDLSLDDEECGFRAIVDPGVYRTKASVYLAALLTTTIAMRNGSRILDEMRLLRQGQFVDPAAVAAVLAKHSDAASFEDLADAFCEDLDLVANWPSARAELAELERSSH